MKNKDISGQKFGRLTAVCIDNIKTTSQRTYWLCKCDCGNPDLKSIYLYQLTSGKTKSCGCLLKESTQERFYKHGNTINHTKDRLYTIWDSMIQRCNNTNNKRYKNYGGRGIKICSAWISFGDFKNWALNNGYNDNLTIERKDVDKGYCPDNCTFITLSEQSKNKTNTKYITYHNENIKLLDVLEMQNKKHLYKKILHRINDLKWSADDAIDNL